MKPSSIGAIPGIITIPVSFSTTAAASPKVIITTTVLPKYVNPFIILSGIFQRPIAINTANKIIGTRFFNIIVIEYPAVNPPAIAPKGIVIIPASTPVAKNL